MVLRKVAILLTLFIFGMTARAWCDPVKSMKGAAVQLTTVKIDENKAVLLKKKAPAKESAEWSKKSQAKLRDVNFLRTLEERKRSQWVELSDKVITSREFSENTWRDRFFGPRQMRENKSSGPDVAQSILKPSPDGNGCFERERILTTLRLLQSKEEILKEIFMGFHFSFDLTNGHVFLEMNVAPSSENRSGFMIRF
jgi:hypothetical protein